jgi:uncharacterized protein (TIGR02145 family)
MKNFKLIIVLVSLLMVSCTNRDGEIIDLINSIKKQNDDLKAQVSALKKTTDSALVAVLKVSSLQASSDKRIDQVQIDLKSVVTQIASISSQMTAANSDLAALKTKIDALQVKCAELVTQISLLNASNFSTVTSKTGRIWMDRNLGATQVATSPTDEKSYGYSYQWGRGNDGHQLRTSATTDKLSLLEQPGNNLFILNGIYPQDWLVVHNNNLWQGVNGVNNVCPTGFRLPTFDEWVAEKKTWLPANKTGAFESVLKLPIAGGKSAQYGILGGMGEDGSYWSSSAIDNRSYAIILTQNFNDLYPEPRGVSASVRCIKD